jgi:hypothetical protein
MTKIAILEYSMYGHISQLIHPKRDGISRCRSRTFEVC